jgi:hypothetical protein
MGNEITAMIKKFAIANNRRLDKVLRVNQSSLHFIILVYI